MTQEFQKWVKLGGELGLVADELKTFIKERQEEVKAERLRVEAVELQKLQLQKEADERRLVLEEKRLAAEKSEREAKFAAEKEADERRIAAEREKEERDLKRLEIQTQEKIRLKELDIRLEQDSRRPEVVQVTNGQEDTRSDNYGRIRDIQMPTYDSEVDDLDIWLCRFERCCTAFRINKDLWVLAMIKSLKGHALEVSERMCADEAHDYEKLKGELLKRFRLTEGGYRRKFKSAMKEKDETTLQFGERLNRYLEKWLQMSGFEEDYDGLKMLIIRDQFLVKCDEEVRCFLKQKGKLDLDDTLTHAQYFYESKETSEREWTTGNKNGKKDFRAGVKAVDTGIVAKPKDKPSENNHHRNSQDKPPFYSPWYEKKSYQQGNRDNQKRGCFVCADPSHRAFNCPNKYKGQQVNYNAMMLCTEEKEQVEVENDEAQVMLLTLEVSDDQKRNSVDVYKDFIDTVKVNGRSVQSLYDTGATKAAIRKGLEKTDQYTGKYTWCKFPNGTMAKYPLAKVEVEGEHFRGLVEVMVVPNLLKEMIITPSQYSRPIKSKTETSSPVEAKKITTKVNRGATTEVEVQTEELDNGYQESNVKCRGDIAAEEEIANYALRSQDGLKNMELNLTSGLHFKSGN